MSNKAKQIADIVAHIKKQIELFKVPEIASEPDANGKEILSDTLDDLIVMRSMAAMILKKMDKFDDQYTSKQKEIQEKIGKTLLIDRQGITNSEEPDFRRIPFSAVAIQSFAKDYVKKQWGEDFVLVNVNYVGAPQDDLGRYTGRITMRNQDEMKQVDIAFKKHVDIDGIFSDNPFASWDEVFIEVGVVIS